MSLVRLRANPEKVRVSIRRESDGWLVHIETRPNPGRGFMQVAGWSSSPSKALVRALRRAESVNMPGIDLGMQWAYEHPHKGPLRE